jgi:hypothetical protein
MEKMANGMWDCARGLAFIDSLAARRGGGTSNTKPSGTPSRTQDRRRDGGYGARSTWGPPGIESFTHMPLRKLPVTHILWKSFQILVCHALKIRWRVCHSVQLQR